MLAMTCCSSPSSLCAVAVLGTAEVHRAGIEEAFLTSTLLMHSSSSLSPSINCDSAADVARPICTANCRQCNTRACVQAMLNDAEVLIPPNEAGWELADGAQEAEQDAAALQQAGADADNVVFSDEDDLSSQSEHSSAEDDSSPGGFTSITDAIEASMSAQAESSDGAYAESNAQSRVGMAQVLPAALFYPCSASLSVCSCGLIA